MTHPDLTIHTGRTESPRYSSPRTGRSHSISSDRPSTSGHSILLTPPSQTSPAAAFIAPSAASQIVTNETDKLADAWADQNGILPSGETALVAPPAMKLVNNFLDQLLFNFLSNSRSTSLAQLRPAVSEVLKPKLAREAIRGAEQELEEYLGGGQDEDLLAFGSAIESAKDWDLELSWKRTRLRCMVYSSLGDMEEDDEEFYTEQEHLGTSDSDGEGAELGVVSPAVAIFLTSVLEFMGEQVLVVAGHAAYQRLRAKHEKEQRDGTSTPADIAERVVVQDCDVERVALDRTLGRLWRGWKKRIRSPTGSISTLGRYMAGADDREGEPIPNMAKVLAEHEFAASIPLPMSDDDIREIEVPGLVTHSDDEEEKGEEIPMRPRPKSLMLFNYPIQGPPTPAPSQPSSPVLVVPKSRKRSHSVPSPIIPFNPMFSKHNKSPVEKEAEAERSELIEADPTKSQVEIPQTSDTVDHPSQEPIKKYDAGFVTGVIAGAAAIGTAAAAGITAVAKGEAPQTTTEESDAEEDLIEEPRIMTSSRVSIGGRISPDDNSRPASTRAPSVHSLRLIEVASGARSPSIKSPISPSDGHDIVPRVISISRSNSLKSPVGTPDPQTPRLAAPAFRNASPLARGSSAVSSTEAISSTAASVSEEDDKITSEVGSLKPGRSVSPAISAVSEGPNTRMSVIPADLAAAMQGVDMDPSPTSQHYVPLPLDKDMGEDEELEAPPPRHPGRDDSSRKVSPARSTEPPLTPPQETAEPIHELPTTHSPKPRSVRGEGRNADIYGHPPTSPRSKPKVDMGKPSEQRQARSQVPQPRSSPPRPSRDEITRKAVPEPTNKRSTHTSSSSSSSHSHKLKPVRTSEDSVPSNPEHPGHNFEELIRSDQTLQYTLTPQNMRNIESPDNARNTSAIANGLDRPVTSRSRTSSLNKFPGLSSNPPMPAADARSISSGKSGKAPSTAPHKTGSRLRPNAPQARDARPDRDSMGDFADFIRSTGPAKSNDMPPRAVSASMTPPRKSAGSRGTSFSSPRMSAILPKRTNTSGAKKLEARDAVVNHDSITDLIDFVRAGPKNSEDHSIPRTVAPFRTTMDSDQLSSVIGGRAIDASLPDARYSQLSTNPSLQSMASQTPLINTARSPKPAPKSPPNRNTFGGEEEMMPKRKTRRVRDPYAIDFSDEEEQNEKEEPEEEESLADFLRNSMPPPEPEPVTSVFDSVPKPRKKSSFFGRSAPPPMPPPKSSSAPKNVIPQIPPPRRSPIAAQFTNNGNFVSQLDSARHPTGSVGSRVTQKTYQPREALQATTRTSDLADFLRNSEPPADSAPRPPAVNNENDPKKTPFGSMFSRRKKVAH